MLEQFFCNFEMKLYILSVGENDFASSVKKYCIGKLIPTCLIGACVSRSQGIRNMNALQQLVLKEGRGYLVLNCGIIRLLMVRMCLSILGEWVATFGMEVIWC